jgi:hypothetical protein
MNRAPEFITHKASATQLGPGGQVAYVDAAKRKGKKTMS